MQTEPLGTIQMATGVFSTGLRLVTLCLMHFQSTMDGILFLVLLNFALECGSGNV